MANGNGLTEAEQRYYWRLRWLSSLQEFTDTSVQTTRWVDPEEANPHYSFVECMCCYFDDALLSDHDAYERMIANRYVTQEEASAVADFHSLADQYHSPGRDDYDTPAILSDPAWHKVVEAAQLAQSSLLPLLTNAFEVAALSDPLFDETTTYGFQAHYPDPANASPPIGPDRKNP